ncbi:MAG: hypothetical protein Kow0098_25270 [Ignavibacteriaceae bacterium]
MKIKQIYIAVAFLSITSLVLVAFNSNSTSEEPEKGNETRIIFSHSLHSELIDCASCHMRVEESTSLKDDLLPDHESCSSCHNVDNDEECSTCHPDDTYEPLIQKESDLIFNHKTHLTDQKLECFTCHSGFEKIDYSWQAEHPNPVMETCYLCHNDKTVASNACESCHISVAGLIPQTHKSADFMDTHKFAAVSMDANCVMCHDNSSCQECHVSTTIITESNTADDFYQPYSPSNYTDGIRQQQISRVHELNYRFTHGIDAKGRTSECQSCHQTETFCSSCHSSEERDFAMTGILPASHLNPNFTTIGVGTGGGEHSVLARRDLESCVSCHDVQGADPTCITCHLDSDGIKGTNPKTHSAGFMRDEKGDWHDTEASVCYNCHTNASPSTPPGISFCGYCHTGNLD